MADFDLNDKIQTKEEVEVMEQQDLMQNRRKMAYYCLYTTIVIAILLALVLIINPNILANYNKIENTLTTLILGWFGIIALYFGASSLAEIFGNKVK